MSIAQHSCRFCGTVIRGDDEIVVVDAEPLHAPCAEAAFSPLGEWDHAAVTTLSQWSRGIGWGSSST